MHADDDGTGARPSVEALAAACRRKRKTVSRALEVLAELGYIDRDRPSRRRATRYTLTLPSGSPSAPIESVPSGTDSRGEYVPNGTLSEGPPESPSGSPPVAEWVPSGTPTSNDQQQTSSSTAAGGHVVDRAAAAGVSLNGRHRDLIEGALERGWTAEQIVDELVPRITAAGVTSPAALAVTVLRELGTPPPPPPPRVDDCPDCQGRGTIWPDDGDPVQCAHPKLAAA